MLRAFLERCRRAGFPRAERPRVARAGLARKFPRPERPRITRAGFLEQIRCSRSLVAPLLQKSLYPDHAPIDGQKSPRNRREGEPSSILCAGDSAPRATSDGSSISCRSERRRYSSIIGVACTVDGQLARQTTNSTASVHDKDGTDCRATLPGTTHTTNLPLRAVVAWFAGFLVRF